MYGVIRTTQTQIEANPGLALSQEDARLHIKSHSHRDDALVDDWIQAAMQHFSEQTGRLTLIETWEYWLDQFPVQTRIELPLPPLRSVESVLYLDGEGAWRSFDSGGSPATPHWEAAMPDGVYAPRGWVQLKDGASWPSTRGVRIRFTAGYGASAAEVPSLVKSILRYIVADFDKFRSGSFVPVTGSAPQPVPMGVDALLRGFKYSALQTIVPRSVL